MFRQRWLEAQIHERAIFEQAAQRKALLPPPPVQPPKAVTPAEYLAVAQQTLFSPDRNPNVTPPPPPPPPKEVPVPPLPEYHGQMSLGDPVVILSATANAPQKSYKVGEKVGPFELISFDRDKITFGWEGKLVERNLREIVAKQAPVEQQAPTAPPQVTAPPPKASGSLGGPSANIDSGAPEVGVAIGGGFRACVSTDKSPNGTVLNGYRKVITNSPMGAGCRWDPIK